MIMVVAIIFLYLVVILNVILVGYCVSIMRRIRDQTDRKLNMVELITDLNKNITSNVGKYAERQIMNVIEGFIQRKNYIIYNESDEKIICPACNGSGRLHIGWRASGCKDDPIEELEFRKVFSLLTPCRACDGDGMISENACAFHVAPLHVEYDDPISKSIQESINQRESNEAQ